MNKERDIFLRMCMTYETVLTARKTTAHTQTPRRKDYARLHIE